MKKIKPILMFMLVIAILAGCQEPPKHKEFRNINKDGSFVVKYSKDSDYKIEKGFTKDAPPTINQFHWYMDALCGDCIRTHSATHEYILQSIKDNTIEIHYHPLNFLSHHSEDRNYSLVLGAWVSGIAEMKPNKALEFMDIVFTKSFKEKNAKESEFNEETLNDYILEVVKNDLKIEEETAYFLHENIDIYKNAINSGSVNIRRFKKWEDISPKEDKSFFVPFIYNARSGGKALLGEEEDTEKYVLGPLKGVIDCNDDCE